MNYFALQRLLWSSIILIVLVACQSNQIVPSSAFTYSLSDVELKNYLSGYPVGFAIKFTNNSTDGTAYSWDFGDGTTSTDKDPTITYAKSGTYTIQLTTTSSTGSQRVTSQPITILDCVLKRVTIADFQWNGIGQVPTWDNTKRADLTLELGQRSPTGSPIVVSSFLYRSEPVKGITNTTVPFIIPVTQPVILNPAILFSFIINLYGNDGGSNQLVYSSGASGIGYSAGFSTLTRFYTISSGPVTLECAYQ
ncbi:PKD domain-containing protein [Spirosoma sp. KUDC1026]|uniref:PKD domain-containing protein n=1 Tax=Spirosoma sp. KUDC1026 TaxID=2745947 RepID=UPI00159BD21E|nr:PKD domain-containing protein [Spirosoma sp. KUDC1026]QKZ12795.1 PKD domain-containing protein [Spirosoma sp. KUDC1026]